MAMASLNASLLTQKGAARPTEPSLQVLEQKTPCNAPQPAKSFALKVAKRSKCKRKSLQLGQAADRDLRLLAARIGVSQQALMEMAVLEYLERAFKAQDCRCRQN